MKYYNEILPRSFFFIVFFSLVKSTECTLCSSHGLSFYRGLLLQVDPDNYLGYNPHSSTDPGGDIISGPAMLQDSWRHGDLSPRIHPKSMDSLLDIHQAEILEDLNSLGRYSRLVVWSHCQGNEELSWRGSRLFPYFRSEQFSCYALPGQTDGWYHDIINCLIKNFHEEVGGPFESQ